MPKFKGHATVERVESFAKKRRARVLHASGLTSTVGMIRGVLEEATASA